MRHLAVLFLSASAKKLTECLGGGWVVDSFKDLLKYLTRVSTEQKVSTLLVHECVSLWPGDVCCVFHTSGIWGGKDCVKEEKLHSRLVWQLYHLRIVVIRHRPPATHLVDVVIDLCALISIVVMIAERKIVWGGGKS